MKKYSWLGILIFAMAFVTLALIISKNEAVRGTFMKAAADFGFIFQRMAAGTKSILFGNI